LDTLLLLLLPDTLEPDREDNHVADFSSREVAGLDSLLFLLRFFSSLMGVAGTDIDMTCRQSYKT
jgi:hypothetical protein